MDKELRCIIDLFEQPMIIYPAGNREKIDLKELKDYIPQICHSEDIYKVHFYGNESYINGILEEIQESELIEYSINKIEYEVN